MTPDEILELTAVLLNATGVILVVRRSIWAFPIGIVGVMLYAWLFWGSKLYADMGLQVLYIFLQVHGWANWHRAERAVDNLIAVRSVSLQQWLQIALLSIVITFVLGSVLAYYTDASLPYLDACAAAISMLAQWWLNRRYLENWLLWIGVNTLYLGIYFQKGLYFTMGLTLVFIILAILGYMSWRKKRAGM